MSKPFIVGAMAVTVADTAIGNLSGNSSKLPAVRILIGGYLVTVVLLLTSEKNEELADSFAMIIMLAALINGNGGLLSKVVDLTDPSATITGVKGKESSASSSLATPSATSSITGNARVQALKKHEIAPELVPIASQPNLKLDRIAAESFNKVEAQYGRTIYLSGSSRTPQQQVNNYASDPDRFAKPGTSLHEVGLAVDVHTIKMNIQDTKLVKAFKDNGWYQSTKRLQDGTVELWHWSYGVKG